MDDLYQKYLESAVHFLSYRARSEKEVRDNLTKKKASSEMVERVISWLKEQRFLNDADFARQWVESRARSKPKSMRLIKMELRQKGVSQDIIDTVVSDPETQVGSDRDRARKITQKKYPKYKNLPRQEIYQKLGGVLARNGFDWDTIKSSIDEVLRDGV
jgi:regulatory protein